MIRKLHEISIIHQLRLTAGIFFLLGLFSCRDPYKPEIISTTSSYLVIEGILNAGGPTTINITRTSQLDSNDYRGISNAIVTVEGKDNSVQSLMQSASGVYTSPGLSLVLNNEYRLRIKTTNGKEYISEYVKVRQTPAIDSISWKREADGVTLFANSHDPSDNTRYYLWNYDETWEIHSYYYSQFIYDADTVRARVIPAEQVYQCWKYSSSKNILIGSSARLQSDIISEAPINFIENGNEKLKVRYSILVRQFALDKSGYEFYELMKKNTESLGTIFDAQPTEIRGNIQCVNDPSELVIGYVTASTVSEKRIFIEHGQLLDWTFYENCPYERIVNHPDSIYLAFHYGYLSPFDAEYHPLIPDKIVAYLASFPACVECPKRGGSLLKPSYW